MMLIAALLPSLALLAAGAAPPGSRCVQEPEEPSFYTPFARRFLGETELVCLAEVRSASRIGVTEKVVTQIEVREVLVGEAHDESFPVLTDLSHGAVAGARVLLFLDRTEGTRQYWAEGCVRHDDRNYADKLSLVRDYLEVRSLPAENRFPRVLEVLERRLRGGRAWARWNALRELADIAVAFPERIEEHHVRRWEAAFEASREWRDTVRRLEREWRKARAARG